MAFWVSLAISLLYPPDPSGSRYRHPQGPVLALFSLGARVFLYNKRQPILDCLKSTYKKTPGQKAAGVSSIILFHKNRITPYYIVKPDKVFGRHTLLLHLSDFPCLYHRRVDRTKFSTSKNPSLSYLDTIKFIPFCKESSYSSVYVSILLSQFS